MRNVRERLLFLLLSQFFFYFHAACSLPFSARWCIFHVCQTTTTTSTEPRTMNREKQLKNTQNKQMNINWNEVERWKKMAPPPPAATTTAPAPTAIQSIDR